MALEEQISRLRSSRQKVVEDGTNDTLSSPPIDAVGSGVGGMCTDSSDAGSEPYAIREGWLLKITDMGLFTKQEISIQQTIWL